MTMTIAQLKKEASKLGYALVPDSEYKKVNYLIGQIKKQGELYRAARSNELTVILKSELRKMNTAIRRTLKEQELTKKFLLRARQLTFKKGIETIKEAIESEIKKIMPGIMFGNRTTTEQMLEHLQPEEVVKSAYNKNLSEVIVKPKNQVAELDDLLKLVEPNIILHQQEHRERSATKLLTFNIGVSIDAVHTTSGEELKDFIVWPRLTALIDMNSELGMPEELITAIKERIENLQDDVNGSDIKITGYNYVKFFITDKSVASRRAGKWVDLPASLKNRKCFINPKYRDETVKGRQQNEEDVKCFQNAVLANLYHSEVKKQTRVESYQKYIKNFNWEGINYPVSENDIDKFEAMNDKYAVCVYTQCQSKIVPLRISKNIKQVEDSNIIKLFYFNEKDNEVEEKEEKKNNKEYIGHFVAITDLSKMFCADRNYNGKMYYCLRCMGVFNTEIKKKEHEEYCNVLNKDGIKVELPSEEDKMYKFKNFKHQIQAPIVVVFDTESTIKADNKHICNSVGYRLIIDEPFKRYAEELNESQIFIDDKKEGESLEKFLNYLTELEEKFIRIIENPPFPNVETAKQCWSVEEKKEFIAATHCHICGEILKSGDKVLDHCHFTNKIMGAAHNVCNLNRNYKNAKVVVIAHNSKAYDLHYIVTGMSQLIKSEQKRVHVIPLNTEKYLALNVGALKFIDSMSFFGMGLDKVAKSMKKEDFKYVYTNAPEADRELCLKKGIYPYEFIDSLEKLNTANIIPRTAFKNKLNGDLSEDDYKAYKHAWNVLKCKTLRDYHKWYLETDVNLLTDILINFRKTSMEFYGLDPYNYVSAPALSWDALFKYSKCEIELMTDQIMYHAIESQIRGGMSFSMLREFKKTENNFAKYLDANSLYASAMIDKLPLNNFRWEIGWDIEKIMNHDINGDTGGIAFIDAEIPEDKHDYFNDYCLMPEKLAVKDEWRSEYQKALQPKHMNCEKLTSTLYPKTNYAVSFKLLQLYVNLGAKVTKVHKVILYDQSNWMAGFINNNVNKRVEAKNKNDKFGSDFYKLMNNSVYGKTIENPRKRINFKLSFTENTFNFYKNDPLFRHPIRFSENMVGCHMKQAVIKLDKPTLVGFVILDLSKYIMYDFYYNKLKPLYPDVRLHQTDTDSIIFSATGDPTLLNKYLHDNELGKLKDEFPNDEIMSIIALRSKMYSIKLKSKIDSKESEKKVAKGIQKNVIKNDLSHKSYLDTINGAEPQKVEFWSIRSKKHEIETCEVKKIGLSGYNDKAYLIDPVNQLAYGHYRINK